MRYFTLPSCFSELVLQVRQGVELRGADEGEVGRVEEQDRPLALLHVLGQGELAEVALLRVERGELEVGDGLADLDSGHG